PTIIAALFLLLIRRTPTSTLFPYTTLFRSVFQCGIALAVGKAGDQIGADAVIHTHGEMVGFQIVADFKSGLVLVAIDLGTVNKQDRKSTRLNSSHVKISYAVFCLKKKTIEK